MIFYSNTSDSSPSARCRVDLFNDVISGRDVFGVMQIALVSRLYLGHFKPDCMRKRLLGLLENIYPKKHYVTKSF